MYRKKSLLKTSLFVLGFLMLTSCGGDNDETQVTFDPNQKQVFEQVANLPEEDLSQEEIESLIYMWNEEKLAKDLYYSLYELYDDYKASNTFENIASRSETVHQELMEILLDKYQLSIDDNPYDPERDLEEDYPPGQYSLEEIQQLYENLLSQGQLSFIEALKVGCIVEVTDVEDLEYRLSIVGNQDIKLAFEFLKQGSYNHYWAFDNALKNNGIDQGCCVLGVRFCKTPEEFPPSNNTPY